MHNTLHATFKDLVSVFYYYCKSTIEGSATAQASLVLYHMSL